MKDSAKQEREREAYLAATSKDERLGYFWIDLAVLHQLRGDKLYRAMRKRQRERHAKFADVLEVT